MNDDPQWRGGPPAPIRVTGKAITWMIARFPSSWAILRRPTQRFFDRLAPDWERRTADPNRLAPVEEAIAGIDAEPVNVLDLGTGTGVAARWLAERFPGARVVGIDVAEQMISTARAGTSGELAERVRFEVADATALTFADGEFDLIVQVSAPAFFAETSRVLAPGGHLVIVSSLGPATPFHTPVALLRRGFEREGLEWVREGAAGRGTYYVLRKPG